MAGYVEECDVSSGYGYINSHNYFQQNVSKSLMKYNDRDDKEMNANLQNGDVISGIVLLAEI